jgi:hypothetical protein
MALTNQSKLTSKNDLFLIPRMRLAAMATGHSARLELSSGEDIFFNHHPRDIEFFCYRTPHQDSLNHSANMSHQRLKARTLSLPHGKLRRFFKTLFHVVPAFPRNKKPTTFNKHQQAFAA